MWCEYASFYVYFSTPEDENSGNGMEYSFTCFRKMSDRCSMAARAEGKVDTKLTGFPPVISIGIVHANMRCHVLMFICL